MLGGQFQFLLLKLSFEIEVARIIIQQVRSRDTFIFDGVFKLNKKQDEIFLHLSSSQLEFWFEFQSRGPDPTRNCEVASEVTFVLFWKTSSNQYLRGVSGKAGTTLDKIRAK